MPVPTITDSEWIIMEALWENAPRTASQVAKAVASQGWADNTVRTLLVRLVEKGALKAGETTGGVREFTPAVKREACVRAESRSFLQRVFRGASKPLLAHFAANVKLTPEEVEELKRLLDASLKNNKP
jgi:BlaI family transcriptional regulator, penicillinase repressor